MFYTLILVVHIFVCIGLIIAVLLQAGKGADIGAVFGGAGSQALFGSAGPRDFINKATIYMVVVFMLTSLTLGYFSFDRPNKSIMSSTPAATQAAPAAPTGQAASPATATPSVPAAPVAPAPPAQ